jgi:PPOX class probable F420-dependent enzyme
VRLEPGEARERFAAARVARLATVDASGRPHLVPVTFAVDGDVVAFAVDHKPKTTTRLRRLANIAANPAVGLLVDVYDEDWARLWWARADGTAAVLEADRDADRAARDRALASLAERYAQYREVPLVGSVVVVSVSRWSGWAASAG